MEAEAAGGRHNLRIPIGIGVSDDDGVDDGADGVARGRAACGLAPVLLSPSVSTSTRRSAVGTRLKTGSSIRTASGCRKDRRLAALGHVVEDRLKLVELVRQPKQALVVVELQGPSSVPAPGRPSTRSRKALYGLDSLHTTALRNRLCDLVGARTTFMEGDLGEGCPSSRSGRCRWRPRSRGRSGGSFTSPPEPAMTSVTSGGATRCERRQMKETRWPF